MKLPAFDVDDYRRLLTELADVGFSLAPVGTLLETPVGRVTYLRHDVDFDPLSVSPIAEVEAALGARATYYVLLTQHYNPWQVENRRAIRSLVEHGHEIGLHYDMETYPRDPVAAREHLRREVDMLADLAETPVTTISMHQPSMGDPDPFLEIPPFVHPHNPKLQNDLVYVSDSCRGWRDTTLLACLAETGPRRVLLNTHPELWLDGSISDRMVYLDLLRDRATGHYRTFVDTVVRQSWLAHPGSRLHDERESQARGAAT